MARAPSGVQVVVSLSDQEREGKIMRLLAMAGLLIASGCWAQEPPARPQQPAEQSQEQTPAATQKETFTIPAGTRVPLTLTNPIWARTARPGDSVRAVTAFPVTIGTQVMIPPGTYVEGSLERVIKRDSRGYPALQAHFRRIVFSNGYALALEGTMAQARVETPGAVLLESSEAERQDAEGMKFGGGMGFQQQPPPLPRLGPSPAKVAGIAAGTFAAGVVALVLLARHRGADVLFDAGWQFEMLLQSPLELDAERVAAAIAGPSGM
jgi:hypothetical protein